MSRKTARWQREGTPTVPDVAEDVTGTFVTTDIEGVHVVHREAGVPPQFVDAAASLAEASGEHGTILVAALPTDDELDVFAERLAPVVGGLRSRGIGSLRLVMSHGAVDRASAPSPARRFCEDWGLEVVAASGPAVVVPGGTLFSPDGASSPGGWWHFSPGSVPRRLGARYPVPAWEGDLRRVDVAATEEHLIQHVPAGLLIQPVGMPAQTPTGIGYAVPMDFTRPQLLVGGSEGRLPVSADALADLLAALPRRARDSVRLLPADGRDLLHTGQELADMLGLEVEIASGLPLLLESDPLTGDTRTLVVGPDGSPVWEPYVESVTCVPAEDGGPGELRVVTWRSPVPGLREGAEPGVFLLDDRWQAALTWSGLWVGRHGDQPPPSSQPVNNDVVVIDLGVPGRGLDNSLWPQLDVMFASLEDEVRERAVIHVHGNTGAEGLRTLRRLAVRHGMTLVPKGQRATAQENAAAAHVLATPLATPLVGSRAPQATAAPSASSPPPAAAPVPIMPPVQYVTTTGGTGPGDHSLGNSLKVTAPAESSPAEAVRAAVPEAGAESADGVRPAREAEQEGSAAPAPAPQAQAAQVDQAQTTAQAGLPAPASVPVLAQEGFAPAPAPRAQELGPAAPPVPGPAPAPGPLPDPSPQASPLSTAAHTPPEPSAVARTGEDTWESARPAEETWPPPVPVLPRHEPAPTEPEPFTPLFTSTASSFEVAPPAWAATAFDDYAEEVAGQGTEPAQTETPGSEAEMPSTETGMPDAESETAVGETSARPPAPVLKEISYLPVRSVHRSTAPEQRLLRSYLGTDWERHASAVQRVLTRLPGLRSAGESDDVLGADLTAVHAYIDAGESPASRPDLAVELERRDSGALAYLACLASGLRRLPSFRGAAVRTAGIFDAGTKMLLPGEELGAATPIGAQALEQYPSAPDDHYLIWSMTGRRVSSLLNTGTGPDSGKVLFGPATRLRVLRVRQRGDATVVLLRELPPGVPPAVPGRLDASDLPVLDRLTALADRPPAMDGGHSWPVRSSGLLGVLVSGPSGEGTA
ncbi:hypothetical protein ACFY8K_37515 [Streptomyces misionensis]|uniref:hypothetical protein n=1 Tax=Streptomyces misionensis TaxID=67331 RepID=UPI00368B4CC4